MVRSERMRQGVTISILVPVNAVLIAALCALLGACGPIGYVNQVTIKADASVAAAKTAGAETYAPYWYTRALEYLHKAREEAAYADFQAANRFGRRAHEAAVKAEKLTLKRAANPSNKDWMPPPGAPGAPAQTPGKEPGQTPDKKPGPSGRQPPNGDGDGGKPSGASSTSGSKAGTGTGNHDDTAGDPGKPPGEGNP
jgi:hypothetical protein